MRPSSRYAFTLIELLVVIAIIAILAVVVVLTLNPAELLKQSRDSNRLSDMATVQNALNIYSTDLSGTPGFSMGNASSVYLSLPDTSNICANLNLPTTSPSSVNYACASATSSRNINGSGWIPVNFASTTAGSPLSSLPIDPTNQSSTGLYYSYYANGTQYEATAIFESSKYKTQYSQKPLVQNYPGVDAVGNSLTINPLFNPSGLVGYWPMDEGSGLSTIDASGNGNTGTLITASTTCGSSCLPQWSAGKIGNNALTFNGLTSTNGNWVDAGNASNLTIPNAVTMAAWVKITLAGPSYAGIILKGYLGGSQNYFLQETSGGSFQTGFGATGGNSNVALSSGGNYNDANWHFIVAIIDTINEKIYMYIDGKQVSSATPTGTSLGQMVPSSYDLVIGTRLDTHGTFPGLIDDVRVYNRVLSLAEIQSLYNAQR